MSKLKKIFTNVRILVLLVAVLIALILIHPSLSDGVAIRSVAKNSVAMDAGMASPAVNSKPMSREVIISINNNLILTEKDYHDAVAKIGPDETFTLKTNKNTYFITTRAPVVLDNSIITTSNDTSVNATVNTSVITTINTSVITPVITPVNTTVVNVNSTTIEDIGLTVYPRPKSNIKKGLDLEGGTRVLLQPMEEVTPADMDIVVSNIEQRLNVYGVSDVSVSVTKDLFGKSFISVEIPGANEQEVKNLLAEQGKFEAKVGNITVFKGGNKDILYVCRTATCSGITPGSCTTDANGATCRFRFSITLSGDAAKRQAAATQNLNIIHLGTGVDNAYLDKNISLYLDDELVDELMIGADLRGNPVTEISISGSGTGDGTKTATTDSLANMKKLQTVLVTGSLPVKLKIVKTESISPTLGSSFIKNATFAGLIALLCVVLLVAIRYREWQNNMLGDDAYKVFPFGISEAD